MMIKLPAPDRIKYAAVAISFLIALFVADKVGLLWSIFFYSVCRKVYIPVGFWSLVLLYIAVIHRAFFKNDDNMIRSVKRGIVLGLVSNLYIALTGLVLSLTQDHSFLSGYYFLYIECALVLFTLLISIFSFKRIMGSYAGGASENPYYSVFYLPLFLLPLFFVGFRRAFFSGPIFVALTLAYILPCILLKAGMIGRIMEKFRAIFKLLLNPRVYIITIFILSFFIRFLFSVNIIAKTESGGQGMFIMASDDGPGYDGHARDMAKDPDSTIGTTYKVWGDSLDDGYSMLLALVYKVFGRNFYAVTFIQSLIGAVLPVLIFLLGRNILSKEAGMLAGLAATFKGPLVLFSAILGHEAIWIPLAVLAVFLLSIYYRKGGKHILVSAGIALGFLCVFRCLYIYLLPFAAVWIITLWHNKTLRERLTAVLILVLSALLIMSIISIALKSPISLGSKQRVLTLWEVNHHVGNEFETIGNKRLMDIGINFARDIPGSFKKIAGDPLKFISVACQIYPGRIWGYLEAYQFGFFDPIYLINSANRPNDFMPTLEFYFTIFFVWGLFLCLKRSDILKSPLFLILVFNILVYAVIFYYISPRYRDASTPFIYLIGSYGLVSICGYLLKD